MIKSLSYRQLAAVCLALAAEMFLGCESQAPTFTPYPTGSIAVFSDPTGAAILLDGLPTGMVTPDTLPHLQLGNYQVSVALDHHSVSPPFLTVNVAAEQVASASFTLQENPGGILVRSFPAGATIFLDGNETGLTTPDTLANLASGDYVVHVERAGYTSDPENAQVTVHPDEIATVDFNLSAPQTGNISVTSNPDGATVILDGTDTDRQTPTTLTGLEAGDHVVKVDLHGYAADPESLVVTVVAMQTAPAHFEMIPLTGDISVSSTPEGASIFLDGSDTGEITPATLTGVDLGDHTVSVMLSGFTSDPEFQVVNVQAGQTAEASFTMSVVKVVLLESFSNVSCIGCPEMAATIHQLMSTPSYGLDRLLAIKYSMNWPQVTDPHYQANPSDNMARATFYQDYLMIGIPTLAGDGALLGASGNPPELTELTALVDAMLTAEPGFALEVEAPIIGTVFDCTVTLRAVTTVDLSAYTLDAVLVENPILYDEPPGNQGEIEFHWVMRDFHDMIGSIGIVTPDSPAVFTHTLTRDASWPVDHLFIIAFVQHNTTRAILQAGSNAVSSHGVPAGLPTLRPQLLPTTPRSGGRQP